MVGWVVKQEFEPLIQLRAPLRALSSDWAVTLPMLELLHGHGTKVPANKPPDSHIPPSTRRRLEMSVAVLCVGRRSVYRERAQRRTLHEPAYGSTKDVNPMQA